MNEKIEQEAALRQFNTHLKAIEKIILDHRGVETRHVHWHECLGSLAAYTYKQNKDAHNAALSEVIEKVKRETSETHRDFKAWTGNEIIELLQALKK